MKIHVAGLNKNFLQILKQIGQAADRQGLTVYVVGGFVRDLILKKPNLDVDVVVEGDAIEFARSLAKEQKADVKVYKDFGTATLFYPDGFRLDFATARQEVYSRPGALPTVSPGSIRDDLFRRDFTINAMAMVINEGRFGELVDIFDGRNDLKKGSIRIMHNKSFMDDPTRILRAVRFEQRFNFRIEPGTLSLLKSAIKNDYVEHVTLPRYFEEFKKILKEASPVKSIKRLQQLRGLEFLKRGVRPNLAALSLIERNIKKIQNKNLYKGYADWWFIYLIGLIGSFGPSQMSSLLDSLNLTRSEKASLSICHRSCSVIKQLKKRNLKPRQIYEALHSLPRAIICFIRVRTSANIIGRYIDNFLKIYSEIKLSITGQDLKQLGIPEGEAMGKILHELLLRKVDGKLRSRVQELKEVDRVKIG